MTKPAKPKGKVAAVDLLVSVDECDVQLRQLVQERKQNTDAGTLVMIYRDIDATLDRRWEIDPVTPTEGK